MTMLGRVLLLVLHARSARILRATTHLPDQQWWIQTFGSKVDLRQDGIPREEFVLDPGVEIGVGPTTVIAESLRSSAVRRRPLARDRRRR